MIWAEKICINEIDAESYNSELEKTPPEMYEKIKNYKADVLKRTLAGRLLIRKAVKEIFKIEDFVITYNKNGKPLLNFCFFNISHSGDYVICVLSDKEIGVDIQTLSPLKKRESYMLFCNAECRFVNGSCNIEQAFYTIWTMKEAYIKAVGGVLSDCGKTCFVTESGELKTELNGYCFKTQIAKDYVCTICEKSV